MLKIYGLTLTLLLGLSAGAQASRVTGNSSYGSPSNTPDTTPCSSLTFSGTTSTCNTSSSDIIAEAFAASTFGSSSQPSDFVIFDFTLTGPLTGDLVLTTSSPIPADLDPGSNLYSYGVFTCPTFPGTAQCTTDTVTMDYCVTGDECINTARTVVTLPLSDLTLAGTLQDPVFFVVVDDAPPCALCSKPSVTVSAAIEPAAAVPEPGLLPIAGVAAIFMLAFYRRRAARLKTVS
jgi:hypothetical protein